MERGFSMNIQGNKVKFSRATSDSEIAKIVVTFGYPLGGGQIYSVKVNGTLAGFAGYYGDELSRIYVSKQFRSFGPIAENLLKYSIRDYFSRNKMLQAITFRAASHESKKQKALERWYESQGAKRSEAGNDFFFFARPRGKETLIKAREKLLERKRRYPKSTKLPRFVRRQAP